jgi:hypothetical protein
VEGNTVEGEDQLKEPVGSKKVTRKLALEIIIF